MGPCSSPEGAELDTTATETQSGSSNLPFDGRIDSGWDTVAFAWIVTIGLLLAYGLVVTVRLRKASGDTP
jgi:hypothetical protein